MRQTIILKLKKLKTILKSHIISAMGLVLLTNSHRYEQLIQFAWTKLKRIISGMQFDIYIGKIFKRE